MVCWGVGEIGVVVMEEVVVAGAEDRDECGRINMVVRQEWFGRVFGVVGCMFGRGVWRGAVGIEGVGELIALGGSLCGSGVLVRAVVERGMMSWLNKGEGYVGGCLFDCVWGHTVGLGWDDDVVG